MNQEKIGKYICEKRKHLGLTQKAEQNMKELIENCDKQQKKNAVRHFTIISFASIIIVVMSQVIYWQGFEHVYAWFDTLSILVIGVVALFCLIVTKTQGDFTKIRKILKESFLLYK